MRWRVSDTLGDGHCYPTLHTLMITGVIWVCVASLSGRTPQPQIITALRTVLFISHPFGVIYVITALRTVLFISHPFGVIYVQLKSEN